MVTYTVPRSTSYAIWYNGLTREGQAYSPPIQFRVLQVWILTLFSIPSPAHASRRRLQARTSLDQRPQQTKTDWSPATTKEASSKGAVCLASTVMVQVEEILKILNLAKFHSIFENILLFFEIFDYCFTF